MTAAARPPELDDVRQGLRMAAPPDPALLAAEREHLQRLDRAPLGRRWLGWLRLIGPGYLQSAMTLGSGTAAASLFAGAAFGYELLWVAPVGMLLGVVVMGVVSTGARPLPAMARHASRWLAQAFAIAAVLASIVWHFPQYNLAAGVLVDGADALGVEGVEPMAASAVVLVQAVLLSWTYGKSPRLVRTYERLLKYTVWGIVLLLRWVVLGPPTDGRRVLAGSVPGPPDDRVVVGGEPVRALELVVAGVAAAVGINMLLLYPYSLLARGWGREHRGLARFDLVTGMLVPYALASGLMVVAAANTLHASGTEVSRGTAVDTLARVLGDVIGPLSGRLLFDLGMLAMALSTITLHMVCCGFVAMEWFGLPFGSKRQRLCTLLPVPGALAPLLWGDYVVYLAVPTTIICGGMLPVAYLGFLLLQQSRAYLGADRPTGATAVLTIGGLVAAIAAVVLFLGSYVASLF